MRRFVHFDLWKMLMRFWLSTCKWNLHDCDNLPSWHLQLKQQMHSLCVFLFLMCKRVLMRQMQRSLFLNRELGVRRSLLQL